MNPCKSPRLLSGLLPLLFLVATDAGACPDCALINSGGIIEPQTIAAKLAFSFSTLLMMGIFFCIVGFLVWMMIKTCRDLAQERSLTSPKEV